MKKLVKMGAEKRKSAKRHTRTHSIHHRERVRKNQMELIRQKFSYLSEEERKVLLQGERITYSKKKNILSGSKSKGDRGKKYRWNHED